MGGGTLSRRAVRLGLALWLGAAGSARADFFDDARRTFQSDIPHFFQDDVPCAFGGKPTSGARRACKEEKPRPRESQHRPDPKR